MRFVAGRGAVAERLQRSGAVAEMLAAAWRIAIGKKLLPGRAIGKLLPARVPWQSCWSGVPWRRGWRHCGREPSGSFRWPGAPWRIAIGKLLLARALQRSTIGKQPLPEMRATAGKERYCWKGEILLEMRATAGKEMRTTAGKESHCRK